MLLKLSINNIQEWKAIISAISDVAEDAMFICNDDGITFRGMDVSHITLLDITMPKSFFDEFVSQTNYFVIKVKDFKDVVDTSNNDDTIKLQIDEQSSMNIFVNGEFKMEYKLRLMEKSNVNWPIPQIIKKSIIEMNPMTLEQIVTNLEKVSKYVTIATDRSKVQFFGQGDMGSAKAELRSDNSELKKLSVDENSSSTYGIEYFKNILANIGRLCPSVKLELGPKTPIQMEFVLPSMIKIVYFVVPRN